MRAVLNALSGLLGATLLLVPALLVPATLRVRDGATFVVAALVSASATIVMATIGLSFFDVYGRAGLLAAQLVIAAMVAIAWMRVGRPRPPSLRPPTWAAVRTAIRAHPALAFLGVTLALALAVELVLAVAVAPNNWDSMTYHLARVAYWLQEQSVLHFSGGTGRQLAQPPNGEFLQGWTLAVTDTDRFAPVIQWIALVGLLPAIAGIARLLGFSWPASAFAAALFALLPQPVLQATSTQNDLIAAFFAAATVLLGWRGLRDRHRGELVIGGAALGLAVGTKGTFLLALPGLALVLGIVAARVRPPRHVLAAAAGCAAIGVIALGIFNYALNVDTYGGPLGPISTAVERVSPLGDNAVRSGWSLVDMPGTKVEWVDSLLSKPAYRVFGDLRSPSFAGYTSDTAVNEDTSAYGLLGFLLIPPLLIITVVAPRVRPEARAVAGAALLVIVLSWIFTEQNPWVGRLLMTAIALGAPLLAFLYERSWMRTLAIVGAVVSLVPSLLTSVSKPILTPPNTPTILAHDRLSQQTRQRPEVAPAVRALDRVVPSDATIGLVRGGDSWDYVFFGPDRARRVVPMSGLSAAGERLRGYRPAGVVFANIEPPLNVRRVGLGGEYWFVPARELRRLAARD